MVGAYGWAFVNPIRKLWYNLTITPHLDAGGAARSAASRRWACSPTGSRSKGAFWDGIGALNDGSGFPQFRLRRPRLQDRLRRLDSFAW
jgi:high-affinity nickel-transport protein